jgi:hypothetical protein
MHRRWRVKHPEPPPKDGLKPCPECKKRKPKSEFYKNRATWDGLQSICKTCQCSNVVAHHKANKEKHAAYQLKWSRANPDRKADIYLKTRLGVPHGTYAQMLTAQQGCCAICGTRDTGKMRRFHLDHDATSGGIRGLLCGTCNTGIGQLRHSEELLRSAIEYLKRYS